MRVKKMFSVGIMAVMLTVVGAGSLITFANNHEDTRYKFNFLTAASSQYTDARPKYDDSYVYVYNKSGVPFTAGVIKANYGTIRCNPVYAAVGHSYKMTNWAFEDNGHQTISVRMSGLAAYGGVSEGVWSPDSI